MSYEYMRSKLEEYFSNNWISTQIAFDNVPFDPPDNEPWVRIGLRPITAENASIGDDCKRYSAYFYSQVFVPINQGAGEAYRIADQVIDLMSNKNISGVNSYQGDMSYIGDDGVGWLQLSINIPFWYQN